MKIELPKATHEGELPIGDMTLDCAVLNDKDRTRVLSERAVTKGLGGKRGGAHWRRKKQNPGGANLPVFVSANNLKPFIDNELMVALSTPMEYHTKSGAKANGIKAGLLPQICNVFLKARDANALHPSQIEMAKKADILTRGLAHVGILALVDEATGFQYDRAKTALAEILEQFITNELRPWVKTFPDDFYTEMFRLKGWQYLPVPKGKPAIVGKYTNDIVYARLAPAVLGELKKVTPKNRKGQYKARFHQSLTENIGFQKLKEHLAAVTALMRASANWSKFNSLLNRALPRHDETMLLDFKDLD